MVVAAAAVADRSEASIVTGPPRPGRGNLESMSQRVTAATGALLAALAVALGAFGAHALEGRVVPGRLETFETAARYLMYHALGLLLLSRMADSRLAALLITAGVAVFSGTLVLLVLTDTGWLGAITPIGGVLMISGWLLVAWRQLSARRPD